ncbi:MFS transporter [Mycena maculata]|uniref:MFS transporter n=1 Tax=Mycena maculata TaxID=230809 RepID=A0AAD7J1X1_9AGAR|nr:MFS transporter [Mycena maculata]
MDEDKQGQEERVEYPKGLRLHIITIALCLSIFVVALDNTIIGVAIPRITDEFDSLDDVGWYGSAYFLTAAAFQLFFVRLYSVLSLKWLYIAAVSILEIGSLICAVAPSSTVLIVGRAIAGLGSAGVLAGALIIVAHTVPLARRPIYQGCVGSMYGIANVCGPLLGGALTDKVSWRWCFYINLPLGGLTVFVMVLFFRAPGARREAEPMNLITHIQKFDPWGTAIFIPAIVCLLLALQWGGSKYPWGSDRIVALLVLFGALTSVFIGIQIWKQEDATVPPRTIKQRSIMACAWFALCLGASFYVLIYFLPIYFLVIKGVSPVKSGVYNVPLVLAVSIITPITGAAIAAIGYYTPFMILSTILTTVGAGLLSTFTVDTGHSHWIGYQVIYGIGAGFGFQQPLTAAQTLLSIEDVPTGTSLMLFMQILGGALFVSLIQAGATSLRTTIDPTLLPAVLVVYNEALASVYYVAVAMRNHRRQTHPGTHHVQVTMVEEGMPIASITLGVWAVA